jgi:hypothetical protein
MRGSEDGIAIESPSNSAANKALTRVTWESGG